MEATPLHERLPIGSFLAGIGGFLDAYTYLLHGETFSTLQSGNVILMGIHAAHQQWGVAFSYVVPIIAFLLGSATAALIQHRFPLDSHFAWQDLSIAIEAVGILFIGTIASISPNFVVTTLLSYFAAFQVHTFRKLNGAPYATTMTTGNLRTAGEQLLLAVMHQDGAAARKGFQSLWVAISFGIGAAISALLIPVMHQQTLWASGIVLLIILFVMMRNHR